jgi:hypothetical protein
MNTNYKIMKTTKYITTAIIAFAGLFAQAQNVGINNSGTTPNTSTILDLNTGNTFTSPNGKGLLLPNIALTSITDATTIATPATSLFIYNTATAGVSPNNVIPGFYYWNGAKWVAFMGTGSNNWALTGNGGTTAAANFMGSTDANDVAFKANSTEVFRMGNANTNLMVNSTANTTDFLSSVSSASLNGIGVSTSTVKHGLHAIVTGATASGGNAIFVESQSTTADALVAKITSTSSGMNAITADVTGGNKAGNAIYATSTGAVSYSTIFATNTPGTDGTGTAVTTSNHTIYGILNGTANYSYGIYGALASTTSNNSGGVIGYASAAQYGILGFNDANSRLWGVQTPGDVLIGSTTALATNAALAYTDAAVQISNAVTDKNGMYVYNSGSKSAELPNGITSYSEKADGIYGITNSTTSDNAGVFGDAFNTGTGVIGRANITNGTGVRGLSTGTNGIGVQGIVTAAAGTVPGGAAKVAVLATADNANDYAIFAHNGNAAGSSGGWAIFSDSKSGTSSGNWSTSDANLKTNIKNLDGALAKVLNMRAITYNFKPEYALADEPQIGFLSQEMQNIYPEVVSEMPLPSLVGVAGDGKRIPGVKRPERALFMNYTGLIPVLAQAIKEQQAIIQKLEDRLIELERKSSDK